MRYLLPFLLCASPALAHTAGHSHPSEGVEWAVIIAAAAAILLAVVRVPVAAKAAGETTTKAR